MYYPTLSYYLVTWHEYSLVKCMCNIKTTNLMNEYICQYVVVWFQVSNYPTFTSFTNMTSKILNCLGVCKLCIFTAYTLLPLAVHHYLSYQLFVFLFDVKKWFLNLSSASSSSSLSTGEHRVYRSWTTDCNRRVNNHCSISAILLGFIHPVTGYLLFCSYNSIFA